MQKYIYILVGVSYESRWGVYAYLSKEQAEKDRLLCTQQAKDCYDACIAEGVKQLDEYYFCDEFERDIIDKHCNIDKFIKFNGEAPYYQIETVALKESTHALCGV